MAGDIVYFAIPAPDSERGKAFYGSLFGWEFEPGNVPDGYQISGVTPMGGLAGGGEASAPKVWFGVDDIDDAIARVRELGGEADEPERIASGFMASCRDDQGTSFELWAPAS
jgi:predicted enzyme related to lactoylglutathione lyase